MQERNMAKSSCTVTRFAHLGKLHLTNCIHSLKLSLPLLLPGVVGLVHTGGKGWGCGREMKQKIRKERGKWKGGKGMLSDSVIGGGPSGSQIHFPSRLNSCTFFSHNSQCHPSVVDVQYH